MKIEGTTLVKVSNSDIENGTFIIPNYITEIDSFAFMDCTNLKFINIPDNTKKINDSAFSYCKSLKSINITNNVTYIGYSTFEYCESLESIVIPNGVTYIRNNTFKNCKKLKSIYIPAGVKYIGDCAFSECSNLHKITIPNNVKYIGNCAFWHCESLRSITIPNSVTHIGYDVFTNCTSLQSITIPNNVEYIGSCAFRNCTKLIKKGKYKICKINRGGNKITYSCGNRKYEIGKQTPIIFNIEDCERPHYYCENLYDVFNYYSGDLNNIALFEIESGDVVKKDAADSKCVTNTIKLVRYIPWNEAFSVKHKNIEDEKYES